MLTADPPHTPKYLVNISADPHFQITLHVWISPAIQRRYSCRSAGFTTVLTRSAYIKQPCRSAPAARTPKYLVNISADPQFHISPERLDQHRRCAPQEHVNIATDQQLLEQPRSIRLTSLLQIRPAFSPSFRSAPQIRPAPQIHPTPSLEHSVHVGAERQCTRDMLC